MRHDQLPAVAPSISAAAAQHDDVVVHWTIRYNPTTKMEWKEHIRRWDIELRALKNTWVLQLADDNLVHPDLVKRWSETVRANPKARVIHVRQQFSPTGFRHASLEFLDGGKCDGGQILFDADFYNSFGWSYDEFGFDGFLFRKMWEKHPDAFVFLDEHLTYHDRLNW